MKQIISQLRNDLKTKIFDQGVHWRILFIGTSVNGSTDIVSSLSRSLRNLGHHVLDVDTRRHKILDNPLGRQGGMGPIFVKLELLSELIEHFEPQMIVCCAGGLTFTEDDAQAIKSKGIVLAGITLSDPDVLPSIVDYQHVFDIHTTNSVEALEMYENHGLSNTVYFPFGIDRGFITQEVPKSSDFEADVICLGHATQRPDRNSMMTYLDERFDVRTYGRGWVLPDSQTVAGNEMVQALRGGKIHINFPLTRAGYVNIKCGVFESASQGRLVATANFPEMEEFFEYGEEIIGYDNEADLANKIDDLLSNPHEYDRIALNGFRRVINEHLYEHRWMRLFETILSISKSNPLWLSRDRAQEISQILSKSLPRAKKIILSGFYGARNLGDELILRSIAKRLMKNDESVQVFVASEAPVRVEAEHGLQSFERKNHSVAADQVKTASAVLLGGGGLWHDYTFERGGGLGALFNGGKISIAGFAALPMMGRVLDIPFYVVGMGVGPLTNFDAQKTVKFVAKESSSIYVRDPESEALLRQVGIDERLIFNAPDVVYAIDLQRLNNKQQEILPSGITDSTVYVGLNLRPWSGFEMDSVFQNVAEAINSLSRKMREDGRTLAVVPMPMQGGAGIDRAAIAEVTRRLESDVIVEDLSADEGLSAGSLVSVLSKCSVVISMRLHAALIAHRSNIPVVGLCYDPKVRRHFDEVLRSEFGLELSASSVEIYNSALAAIFSGMNASSLEEIRKLEKGAEMALDRISQLIVESPTNDRVYEVPTAVGKDSASKSRVIDASYRNLKLSASAESVIGSSDAGIHEFSLSLNTERPLKGDYVEYSGDIRIVNSSPSTLYLVLESEYQNPKSLGALTACLTVANFDFAVDLAESKTPVQLAFNTPGASLVPFRLKVSVEKDLFKARSWERATTVKLRLHETKPNTSSSMQKLVATYGKVTQQPR